MNKVQIELKKAGVFLATADGRQLIAAPIKFHAIGERLDGTKVVEIKFVDCDGNRLSKQFDMAAINPRNLSAMADDLGNMGYLWPTDDVTAVQILKVVVAKIPSRRFAFVGAPGWYDDAIVTLLRQYGGTKRILIDPDTGAHLAIYKKGPGSLKGWRKTVGRLAKKSTGLRLSIAAALAAPLLRPLSMDSFALNLFGPTSTGKSSLLCGAASVPGLIDKNQGLPKWSDSETAIEQQAIGHRDGLYPLDESGDQNDKVEAHVKSKQLAFLFSRNRARTLDKSHQKKINLTVREFRVTVLSTSEFALKTMAEVAGQSRIGGEEVRFIDIPVVEPSGLGVFDGVELTSGRDPGEFGRMLADDLRRNAEIHQGFVMDAFLKKFMRDPEAAVARTKHHMSQFRAKLSLKLETGPHQRICDNFSVIYAAAALGIEYRILPWKKKPTQAAIEKCMAGAFATLRNSTTIASNATTIPCIESAVGELNGYLERLTLISVRKGKRCSQEEAVQRQRADGFRKEREILIKPKSWKPSAAAKNLLFEHQILRRHRSDAVTIERKVMGVPGKPRYYVIDQAKLEAATAGLSNPPK